MRAIGETIPREWRGKAASPALLDHTLAVSDVLVSFLSGAAETGPSIAAYERAHERLVVEVSDRVPGGSVKPDAAVVVDQNGERLCALIEVDRGTMGPTQMHDKFAVYWGAALAGVAIETTLTALLARQNVPLTDAPAAVRVLVTVPSVKRAVQLANLAVRMGVKRFMMLAVHDDVVRSGVFAPVWKSAQAWVEDAAAGGERLVS